MIDYCEYQITGDEPIFQTLEEVKKICIGASIEELLSLYETCVAENLYTYAKYINKVIKNEQAK